MRLLILGCAAVLWAQDAPKPGPAKDKPEPKSSATDYTIDGEIDVRHRFLGDLKGNSDVYRSVVNLGEGPRLFGGRFRYSAPESKTLDLLEISATGWGGDPWVSTRVDGRRNGVYEFSVDYRNVAYFNNLPAFANPLLGQGVLFSQRAYDTRLRQIDGELRLLPSARVSPYFAFGRGMQNGLGITGFVAEGNEYPVGAFFDSAQNVYRGGARIQGAKLTLTLEMGWTTFDDDQRIGYAGVNAGNRSGPFLGRNLRLFSAQQRYAIEGSGPFARAVLQARPVRWLAVNGQFTWMQLEINVRHSLSGAGSFISPQTLAPYNLFTEATLGRALRPYPSGNVSVEIAPVRRFRILQTWSTDRFHVAGNATITAQTVGAPQNTVYDNRLLLNYNRWEVLGIYELTPQVSLRGGYRYIWADATTPGPSFVPRPGSGASGELRQPVALAGGTVRFGSRLTGAFDYEGSPGDVNLFRTSLLNYHRGRGQVRYRLTSSLAANFVYNILDNRNPNPLIGLSARTQTASGGVSWSPDGGKRFTVLGEYSYASWRSDIFSISLPFLGRELLRYRDFGHHANALVDLRLVKNARLSFGGAFSRNTGSLPTRLYQPQAGFSVPLYKKTALVAEWRYFGFSTLPRNIQFFQLHMFSSGLRIGF
jgi:hypothetical protein